MFKIALLKKILVFQQHIVSLSIVNAEDNEDVEDGEIEREIIKDEKSLQNKYK